MRIPKITLEQWAAFKAVVEEGSFVKAAETLNKSQSTLSYAITRLNSLLPTPALHMEGRKAVLTTAGSTLYRYACQLLDQAATAEQAAQYFASGWEPEITLVVDSLTPWQPVMASLQAFSLQSPLTRIRVLETTLTGTEEAILQRSAHLAITPKVPIGWLGDVIAPVRMLPVAAINHPLAQLPLVTETDLKMHRQIVLRDSGLKRQQDAGWLAAEQRWTVSHFASSVDLVVEGLGFAFLPEHRVRDLLQHGQLKTLPLAFGAERQAVLHLVHIHGAATGPASLALAQHLRRCCQAWHIL